MKQKGFPVIIFLAIIGVSVAVTIFSTQQAAPESWDQTEIIGQGTLTDVVVDGDNILLSLQLMTGPYDPENPTYTTYVFCVVGDRLAVQNRAESEEIYIEPDFKDTKRFEAGTWYVLFRKANPLHYLLYRWPGAPHNFPVVAPIYGS